MRLKDSREGASRTLGRQRVPRNQRLQKCLLICGASEFAAQARFAWEPRGYGPRRGIAIAEDNLLLGTS